MVVFFLGVADGVPKGECELCRVWHEAIAPGRTATIGMGRRGEFMAFGRVWCRMMR